MNRGVFVTGTDTGVGKTFAACALLHALRERGVTVAPMKPVAAGGGVPGGLPMNDDTVELLAAAGFRAADAPDVTPVLLREAIAPHIAAQREGRAIELQEVLRAYRRLRARADYMVVEGVGGFCVPLGPGIDTVNLARAFALPVVIVVGLRLGCLNHSLLTAQAVRAAGLPLAGWIANAIDPDMPARAENVATLVARLGAPLLGELPFAPGASPQDLARHLDVTPLLA
jgi:dethiobiotin synthetase